MARMRYKARAIKLTLIGTLILLLAPLTIYWTQDIGPSDKSLSQMSLYPLFKDRSFKSKILILSYLGGGATVMGDVMQRSDDAFYLFEPLRFLLNTTGYFFNGGICSEIGGCRKARILEENSEFVTDVIRSLYNCRKHEVPSVVARGIVSSTQSKLHSRYKRCMASRNDNIYCDDTVFKNCSTSHTLVFKFIRLSMEVVGRVMQKIPQLKVVHILRDPRGIMKLRKDHGSLGKLDYGEYAKFLCDEMLRNILGVKRWQATFPDRIRTVLFEDMVENPEEGTKHLYKFTDMNFTNDIKEYTKDISKRNDLGETDIETKYDSSDWRQALTFTDVKMIDSHCKDVYDVMGLRTFDTDEMMKDETFFSRVNIYKLGDYLLPAKMQ